jgi:YCII-related domain
MAKFVLAYKGGGMAQTDEEREAAMQAWGAWFGALGSAVVDAGNPFSSSKAVGGNGTSGLTGYSILSADDLDAASKLAEGCPILSNGGSVEVYEVLELM